MFFVSIYKVERKYNHTYQSHYHQLTVAEDHLKVCRTFNTREKANAYADKLMPYTNQVNREENRHPYSVTTKDWYEVWVDEDKVPHDQIVAG
jgi:CRISPR/Cas system CSM-associated protein Csm3 (group 7 of RAMP superfamily)